MTHRRTAPPDTTPRSKPNATGAKQPNSGGRPPYAPSDKDRQMVEVLAGFAIPADRIALVVGVTKPTLYKYFSTEIERGSAVVEAKLAGNLLRLAAGADGTALKAIMFALNCRFGWSAYAPRPIEDRPLGKKEVAQLEAERRPDDGDWSQLLQ